MIGDKSTADVLAELRSLVRSREFLVALIKKERWPEAEKAAAVANYDREITALNALSFAFHWRSKRWQGTCCW